MNDTDQIVITIRKVNGWILINDNRGNHMQYLYYSRREALRKFKAEFGYIYRRRVKVIDVE